MAHIKSCHSRPNAKYGLQQSPAVLFPACPPASTQLVKRNLDQRATHQKLVHTLFAVWAQSTQVVPTGIATCLTTTPQRALDSKCAKADGRNAANRGRTAVQRRPRTAVDLSALFVVGAAAI